MKICPRCGKKKLRDADAKNTLSRRCNKSICSDCGTAEAFEDIGWEPEMPLSEWACNKKGE